MFGIVTQALKHFLDDPSWSCFFLFIIMLHLTAFAISFLYNSIFLPICKNEIREITILGAFAMIAAVVFVS